MEIWKHKSRIDNPLLCAEDGPVYQLRRWYEQFYVDVEDVTEEMVARFEFEVDTTRAIEAWEAEVAENLARQQAEREAAERSESKEAQSDHECLDRMGQSSRLRRAACSARGHSCADVGRQGQLPRRRHERSRVPYVRNLVLVRKNSLKHTSVQWTDDPAKTCPTFRDAVGEGQSTALREGCPRLWDSINHAVMEGFIDVRDRVE